MSGFAVLLQSVAALLLRLALAVPFWMMGVTRWSEFMVLRPEVVRLYEGYRPTIAGTAYVLPYPDIFAQVVSAAEIVLPAALVIGFATRLSAFLVLLLTIFLLTLRPGTWLTETLPWAAMALALIAYGPGRISFDWFIWRGFGRR